MPRSADVLAADAAFLAALEDTSLPLSEFTHRNHLRAAWLYLRSHPLPQAAQRCGDAIRQYAAAHGAAGKYHHTLTLAFMHIIRARMRRSEAPDWESFLTEFPELTSNARTLIAAHYSDEVLQSSRARQEFVPPDRQPLPG